MQQGLGALKMSSDDFWSLTPIELECALAGAFGPGMPPAMQRHELGRLLKQYPDKENQCR